MVAKVTSQDAVAFVVAAFALVLFFAALALSSRGRRLGRGGRPDIPPAMQPGPSDADLEKPRLEKLQGWGVAFVLFFVVAMRFVWLREPDNNLDQSQGLTTDSIASGYASVKLFSETKPACIGGVR